MISTRFRTCGDDGFQILSVSSGSFILAVQHYTLPSLCGWLSSWYVIAHPTAIMEWWATFAKFQTLLERINAIAKAHLRGAWSNPLYRKKHNFWRTECFDELLGQTLYRGYAFKEPVSDASRLWSVSSIWLVAEMACVRSVRRAWLGLFINYLCARLLPPSWLGFLGNLVCRHTLASYPMKFRYRASDDLKDLPDEELAVSSENNNDDEPMLKKDYYAWSDGL